MLLFLTACATGPAPTVDPGDTGEPACTACVDWYADADGDGWGDAAAVTCACGPSADHPAGRPGDCDDADAHVNPVAPEVCGDGADNDCSGAADEPGASDCAERWLDADRDGHGGEALGCVCAADGTAPLGGDCDEADATTFPGAAAAEGGACRRDRDGDGFGAADPPAGVEPGTDCDDADATAFPGAPSVCGDGVDQACDGGVGCRVAGGALPDDAAFRADVELDRVGDALAACDPDATGVDALIVGAPHGDDDGAVWRLSPDEAGTWQWAALGPVGGQAGAAVACGDVYGDATPSVIYGAPAAGGGRVVVLPAGDPAEAWEVAGAGDGSFGTGLAVLDDLDGDGAGELAVGDHRRGEVAWVDVGGRSAAVAPRASEGVRYFGQALGAPGDVDGDGTADLLVGAYGADDYAGGVFLFLGAHGRPTGTDADAQARWSGPAAAYAGTAVAGADLDADGYADVIIAGAAADHVWILRGNPSPGHADLDGADARFTGSPGHASLAAGEDVDGDGFADLLVGAPEDGFGAAFLLYGGPVLVGGELTDLGTPFRSTDAALPVGTAVAFAQLDEDGIADLVTTAPGSALSLVLGVAGLGR